jgi:hypothetical protein
VWIFSFAKKRKISPSWNGHSPTATQVGRRSQEQGPHSSGCTSVLAWGVSGEEGALFFFLVRQVRREASGIAAGTTMDIDDKTK